MTNQPAATDLFNEVHADIFTAQKGFIIHGCNDKGVMGAGIAKVIATRFPGAELVYREASDADQLKFGTCTFYQVKKDLWIVNGVTQTLGVPNPVSYDAIADCFIATLNFMIALEAAQGLPYGSLPLLFPKIGAGLGGGDWNAISAKINGALLAHNDVFSVTRPATLYVWP